MGTAPKSQEVPPKNWNPRTAVVWNAVFFVLFIIVTLLIMRKWRSPDPWSAVDANAVAILVLSVLYCVQQLILYPSVFRTRESMDLFVGKHFDRRMPGYLGMLGAVELLAFADYAHWHLVPALRIATLQMAGLVIMFGGLVWMFYVDRYLSKHFVEAWEQHKLMLDGPYRWVRHPRYGALLLSRLGFCLAIGSIIANCVLIGWFVVVWIRMGREEKYLREQFGDRYARFMKTRVRLVPGIY
jgi:protein-S-isoprenylcysteine O-methyltransferase Ste14